MPHSLLKFASDLAKMEVGLDMFHHEVMEKVCVIVEKEAKRVIGTYDYNWTPLAEATQADREAHGFPADEPLLRTGEMRDSIEHNVGTEGLRMEVIGIVGTNNEVAKWQELGTSHIPPRSFLGGAAMHKESEIHEFFGASMFAQVTTALGLGIPHSGAASVISKVEQEVKTLEHHE